MKRFRSGVWCAAVLAVLLAGCSGEKYEKIPGVGEENRRAATEETEERTEIFLSQDGEDTGQSQEEILILDVSETEEETGEMVSGGVVSGAGEDIYDEKSLTFLFSGDVLLSNHVLTAYENAGGIQGVLDEEYREQIERADFFLVNQEFPFSERGAAAEDKQYTFRLPPARVSLFQEIGIDGVTLANNHALDFGRDALLDSCRVLDEAGIAHTGAGADLEAARRPVTVEMKGKKIAVIGATRVIPVADWAAGKQHPGMLAAYDMTVLLEEIHARKQDHDFVAICIHWGIERDERPQEYQRAMAKQMIDAGADLVVGSHPHVLQGIEYYQGKPIVYSLGNFIFGSSIPRTALLQVTWENPEDPQAEPVLRLIPGTSGSGYTRMLREEEQQKEFFRYMERISYGVACGEDGMVIQKADSQSKP